MESEGKRPTGSKETIDVLNGSKVDEKRSDDLRQLGDLGRDGSHDWRGSNGERGVRRVVGDDDVGELLSNGRVGSKMCTIRARGEEKD